MLYSSAMASHTMFPNNKDIGMITLSPTRSFPSRHPSSRRPSAHRLSQLLLMMIVLLTVFTSCEQSDDVEVIFTTRSWCFTGFCYTPNWDKGQSSMLNTNLEGKNDYYLHTLTFSPGGTVSITLPGCSLTAHWTANGATRAFSLTDIRVVTGNLDKLSPFSRKFYEELTAATWYRGDALGLELFDVDEHYYLLFGPIQ